MFNIEYMTIQEAEKRLAEVREKLEKRPGTIIPAAFPIYEEESKELENYINSKKGENA